MKFLDVLISIVLFYGSLSSKEHYLLTAPLYNPGFFSVFNTVIGALDYVEKTNCDGMTLDFENKGLYYEPNFGQNWWEYYFEPIDFSVGEADSLIKFKTYQKIIFSHAAQFKIDRKRAQQIIQRYVKIKPHIQSKINQFYQQYFKGYVVGVHYRGTDKSSEAKIISYKEVYLNILKALPKDNFRIFLATDEALFLQYIQKKFPGKVIAIEAIRSMDKEPVHKDDKKNNYQKGEDALIDCILLSKTNLLIKTASNLSDCSLQFNPYLPVIHLSSGYNE